MKAIPATAWFRAQSFNGRIAPPVRLSAADEECVRARVCPKCGRGATGASYLCRRCWDRSGDHVGEVFDLREALAELEAEWELCRGDDRDQQARAMLCERLAELELARNMALASMLWPARKAHGG